MKEILCITTYPPRECGIATFSDDLIRAVHYKFGTSYTVRICALETNSERHKYPDSVKYTLNTSEAEEYSVIAEQINKDKECDLVLIQHEFGLYKEHENVFLQFVQTIAKPIIIVFHTVLSKPSASLLHYVQQLTKACSSVIVMTYTSSRILHEEYGTDTDQINIIPHGTHLVTQMDKKKLKEKYRVSGRKVLSTFGLLSAGKGIETTLDALPAIVKENPTVLFIIIGKTHPSVLKAEGEKYREMLKSKVADLGLTDSVRFINFYLDLPILLEYLQLTDIYLFTSNDPNQAVSGTFVYALSCGCPIIATPIPHALELLSDNSGIIFDFGNSLQLATAANRLLASESLRYKMRIIGLQKTAATAWENVAIAYALLFKDISEDNKALIYSPPPVNTEQIKRMSRSFGIIQFSKGNRPDIRTGYTLDDSARALMAICQVYVSRRDTSCEKPIKYYLDFIKFCQQEDGSFLNYVDKNQEFTNQNNEVNLEDSNGRAICALGYFIASADKFSDQWISDAVSMFKLACSRISLIQSPRSIAFIIKGLYFYNRKYPSPKVSSLVRLLAEKLTGYYKQNAEEKWLWFEAYLTYDNSILSEGMLYAYLVTGNNDYKRIAKESFDFLLKKVFVKNQIKVVSNQGWLQKEQKGRYFGEQPIDVAGTVIALAVFYDTFRENEYILKQKNAFNWFLGNNHLHQIIYNPATGGCYDGLEKNNVNLNQGAESTVCYLMARLSLLS